MAYVMQVHCPGTDEYDVTAVDHVKMFRNLPDIRFEGRIHEQVLPSIRRLGGEVAWSDVFVVHSGSDQTPEGRLKKYERDLRILRLEIEEKPDHPFVLFNLGMTYGDMGNHEEAVRWLRRTLEVAAVSESHVRKAYALLVHSLSQLGRIGEAWHVCCDGLGHFPQDTELLFRKGVLAQGTQRWEEAIGAYRAALTAGGPRCFSSVDRSLAGYKARHNLALVYARLERWPEAESQWRYTLEEAPRFREGWRGLGEALLRQGRFAAADALLDSMPVENGNRTMACEAAILRAELKKARGESAAALADLAAAAERFPDDVDLLDVRCRLLFEHGAVDEAERALSALCRCRPADGAAWFNLATVYLRRERLREALRAYETSARLRPDHAATREHLRHVRMLLESYGDSGGSYSSVVTENGDSGSLWDGT